MNTTLKTILVSVSDKTGLLELLAKIQQYHQDLNIIATDSTADYLNSNGYTCTLVSDLTGFPAILDGRVKTLHPHVFGGLLARPTDAHLNTLKEYHIPAIDLAIVNLYPFSEKRQLDLPFEKLIEFIDIGGVSLIRAAAKNHERVTILSSPSDYEQLQQRLDASNGSLLPGDRQYFAMRAFQHTAQYDALIAQSFVEKESTQTNSFPETISIPLVHEQAMRYGENPQDAASWYRYSADNQAGLFECLQGKALSYNNLLDTHAACELLKDLTLAFPKQAACCIIKHANPCGVALDSSIDKAYQRAFNADPISAFGGIIALNQTVTGPLAEAICNQFAEIVIAPQFDADAKAKLASKKNLRLLELDVRTLVEPQQHYRDLGPFGMLVSQTSNTDNLQLDVVTKETLPNNLEEQAQFAWIIAKHLRSNAIAVVKDFVTLGLGIGQTSRIASTQIALTQAGAQAKGAILASDGFFPAEDNIEAAAQAGVIAIIQPGGSLKDNIVIEAANQHGVAMALTHQRCFKH